MEARGNLQGVKIKNAMAKLGESKYKILWHLYIISKNAKQNYKAKATDRWMDLCREICDECCEWSFYTFVHD